MMVLSFATRFLTRPRAFRQRPLCGCVTRKGNNLKQCSLTWGEKSFSFCVYNFPCAWWLYTCDVSTEAHTCDLKVVQDWQVIFADEGKYDYVVGVINYCYLVVDNWTRRWVLYAGDNNVAKIKAVKVSERSG
jgi:hypothetical protein